MSDYPDFSSHGYQIQRQLGQNRLGGRLTYLATNTQTRQSFVIKQFQFAQPGASWGDYDAYESEIQLLQQLNHPSIPRYLDSFETSTGFCLVQEYKKAVSLAQPRHFTPEEVKQIAVQILNILVYLQQRRLTVIHRDIKPENILVDRSHGQIKVYLIDFGFARKGGDDLAASSVVKGTLGFMPPEQLFNRKLTKASDLYSLGATLICLLTKTKSTEIGNLMDKDYRINFKPLISKTLNRQFIDWLSKITAPSLQERYPNAVVALNALKPIDVLTPDPSQKLLSHIRQISVSVSDSVLNVQQSINTNPNSTIAKLIDHLKALSINFSTTVNQTPKSTKQTLLIVFTLIFFARVSMTAYEQNRALKQLATTNRCIDCNLQKAQLKENYLKNANLKRANLKKANLKGAILEDADLMGAKLEGANLEGTDLFRTNLVLTHLKNANLKETELAYADLEGANLERANLEDANLSNANLEGANLRNANLKGANLRGANLQNAIMPDGIRNRVKYESEPDSFWNP
ncbi:MAG TPA: protein kinase [Cyanobacteria bacterium UBA12227]|nr:protein kinase [Cyanobacteria bacterium UBA12227]HAX90306.1 protein kinase [Cyanobacteria bacterium UBA11370]HBY78811.1 protein kinase [Cyanobacteria bacterium UBA11148]